MPFLIKIDHVHIYVPNQLEAETWYKSVLDFKRVEALERWFINGGPLTIENGGVHIALFQGANNESTTIAFAVDLINYQLWKEVLVKNDIHFSESDHQLSWSIYFSDPYGNLYEITTYEYTDTSKNNAAKA